MASGDLLSIPTPSYPAGTAVPSLGLLAGGSSPAEAMEVFDFDASTIEYMDFYGRLSDRYASTGITLKFSWRGKAGTSGNVVWQAAIRRLNSAETFSSSHSYSAQSSTDAVSGTLTRPSETTIAFTDGAQMDSLAAGEPFVLRVWRDATNGSDTLTGDAQMSWRDLQIVVT